MAAQVLCDVEWGSPWIPALNVSDSPEPLLRNAPSLAAQTQALDQLLVTFGLGPPHVVQKAAPLAHELEQTAPRMMILLVGLEVFREPVDALREQGHLHIGRTGVLLVLYGGTRSSLACGRSKSMEDSRGVGFGQMRISRMRRIENESECCRLWTGHRRGRRPHRDGRSVTHSAAALQTPRGDPALQARPPTRPRAPAPGGSAARAAAPRSPPRRRPRHGRRNGSRAAGAVPAAGISPPWRSIPMSVASTGSGGSPSTSRGEISSDSIRPGFGLRREAASGVRAWERSNGPLRVRRSSARCAPQPRRVPRSAASVRT